MIEEAFLDENFWEESDLDVWFRTNYRKLGFTEIRSSEGFADYIGIRNGKEFVIELEGPLWHINAHPQKILDKIDIIICFGGNATAADNKEVIRLIDFPEYFTEAIMPFRRERARKVFNAKQEVQKRFSEDTQVI